MPRIAAYRGMEIPCSSELGTMCFTIYLPLMSLKVDYEKLDPRDIIIDFDDNLDNVKAQLQAIEVE